METGAVMFIMIFMVPITAIVVKSPLGKALADRIAGRSAEPDQRLLAEVDALRTDVDQLHEQLAEVHERLDFTERLLARGEEAVRSTSPGRVQ
jgi:hypothetical protein